MSRPRATAKIKCVPDDFIVEELTRVAPGREGPFALYRLTKTGLGTMEAVERIGRAWGVGGERIAYGGLKDRHARTVQHLTIARGPRRGLDLGALALEYLGRVARPFAPQAIAGNRFTVVIRDLGANLSARAAPILDAMARDGLPNYFDSQRFGSVGSSGEFVAERWIAGDFEGALRLALATPHPHDRAPQRAVKETLRRHCGDWRACKAALPRSHERSIVTYLCDHPADFRRAFARLNRRLRSLYLAAFQSFLWNDLLARWIAGECPAERLLPLPLKFGPAPFFGELGAELRRRVHAARLPLPSARLRSADPPVMDLIDAVLAARGLRLRDLRIKHPKDSFFSKGERAAAVLPARLSHSAAEDELYPGRMKLELRFDLPRGAYATLLVKRLGPAIGAEADFGADEPDSAC